jgi:hypothetical protein
MKLIHILSAGFALCGRAGAPVTWGPGESWVSGNEVNEATCSLCREQYARATGSTLAELRKRKRKR